MIHILFHSQIVNFTTPKTSTPTIMVSASHLNQATPEHNSIATWIEVCKCHILHHLRSAYLCIRTTNIKFLANAILRSQINRARLFDSLLTLTNYS